VTVTGKEKKKAIPRGRGGEHFSELKKDSLLSKSPSTREEKPFEAELSARMGQGHTIIPLKGKGEYFFARVIRERERIAMGLGTRAFSEVLLLSGSRRKV